MTWSPQRSRARETLLALAALLASLAPCGRALAGGGPDAFGYTWLASTEGGPPYTPEGPPVGVVPLSLNDDAFISVPLGFPFPFYGDVYESIEVHSNGALSFGRTNFLSAMHTCPLAQPAEPTIFAYYSDLDPTAANPALGGVYAWTDGTPGQRRFLVEYRGIPHYGFGGYNQFEIKLFEGSGRVELHFVDLLVNGDQHDNGGTAAVGIGGPEGVLRVSCDEAALSSGLAIGFYPPCEDLDGDGFGICEGDCDDGDPTRNPGEVESCNGIDDDCDQVVPPDERDEDGDGASPCQGDCDDDDAELNILDADGDGRSTCDGDCDDADPDRSDLDNDGDGATGCDHPPDCDDTDPSRTPFDLDGDGFSTCGGDCDDTERSVAPGAPEPCNGRDDDCNGLIDDNANCADAPADDDDDATASPTSAIPYGCVLGSNGGPPWSGLAEFCALAGALLVLSTRRPRWGTTA